MPNTIFPLGNKIEGGNFTGSVWVQQLVMADSTFDGQVGNVVFESKARSKWHRHPGGQILLALAGHDSWFVQLAITPDHPKERVL